MRTWLFAGVSLLVATGAHAQEDRPAVPVSEDQASVDAEATQVGELVVTGSRAIRNGAQAPTPVTVVAADQLQQAQPGLIGEALNTLPAFRGSSRPTTGGTSALAQNTGSFLNLRNLGAQRTLVLVDGRRAAPSARDGSVDINALPSQLVKRVDVVTGGASAAYGSDAVAGVVNFVLDTRFTGLKAEIQGGVSSENDAESIKFSLTGGQSFADGRGRFVASGQFYESEGVPSLTQRDWGRAFYGSLSNPAVPGQLIFRPNVRSATTTPGGLIISGPLAFQQFLPDGTLAPFDRGSVRSGLIQVGGDGSQLSSNVSADVRTRSLFGHVDYELTPELRVFARVSYADTDNRYNQVQAFNVGGFNGFTIFSGNAFLHPTVQDRLTATNTPAFGMGRINFDFGDPAKAVTRNRLVDTTVGFEWQGPAGWTVNGYYEHGDNRSDTRTENNVILERLFAAADAVRDSSDRIVCRVTLTNPGLYPGCTPINLFGSGAVGRVDRLSAHGSSAFRTVIKQDVAALTARGDLFSTWAGPISAAFGAEYRREEIKQTTDAIGPSINDATGIRGFPAPYQNQPGGWLLTNVFPVAGAYDLWEVFGEVAVPLARDVAWAKSLDFNGAVRYTNYSTSGGVTTWKAGLVYEPIEGLRLRATQSRDIRAPNVPELFAGITQNTGSVIENGATVGIIAATSGNAQLKPEEADTFTAGIVLQPSAVPGLTASIDYYSIDISGVISSLTPQVTRDQCAAGATQLCANITRNTDGVITRIVSPTLNLNRLKTSGVDIEVGYRLPVEVFGGQVNLRGVASYLGEMTTEVFGGAKIDRAGEVGVTANPEWSVTASAEWTRGPFSLFVQQRYISEGTYDVTRVEPTTIEDNSVERVFYADLTASYAFNERMRATVTVNNLFDREPPLAPNGTLAIFTPTNPQLYDQIGRYFTFRLNVRY
ncbi:TonB-dependent receptor plug domain-containing protein [Caulobacter mirabilis]|uniref:TonB-dependent receptor n=1 Tax=Caulobacter mirabilis TaxID=69666 RepID=A0A2D2AZF1_9CAUL|nr:TonB-dependent receptor [Caulobacter mirabilis]ATQ43361.1 TonB-dependent receptor [Caulobacter mirabilis]